MTRNIKKQQLLLHLEPMNNNPSQSKQYRQYGYRYAIAAIYSLLSFVSGLSGVVVTPAILSLASSYDQPNSLGSVIPIVSMIFFVLFNQPANWVLDIKGLRKGLIVGGVLTSIGTLFKCLVDTHFSFVVTGVVLCAMGQPFILNASVKISVRWFSPQNRFLALVILSLSNMLGVVMGEFILPSIFVESSASSNRIQSEYKALLFFEFFMTLIPLTCLKLWFRERPPIGVSSADSITRLTNKNATQHLFKDKYFWTLLIAFGTVYGAFNGFLSLFRNIFSVYGYSQNEINLMPFLSVVAGLVMAYLVGYYLKKTANYQGVFKMLGTLGLLICMGFPLGLSIMKESIFISSILCAAFGLITVSLVPLTLDYACNVLFPVGEAHLCGWLLSAGNAIGVVMILVCQLGLDLGDTENTQEQSQISSLQSIIMISFVSVIGFIMYFFSEGQLKRTQKENIAQSQSLLTSIANL